MSQSSVDNVELVFDRFWVGGAEEPRPGLEEDASTRSATDKLVNVVGNWAFVEGMATFPVLYFSNEAGICVFKFPPLDSAIAAVRVH